MGTVLANKKNDTIEGSGGEKANTELKSEQNVSRPTFTSTDEGNKCSICQDTEIFTDMYALPCAHKFHEQCINEWLKKKSVCPICRFRIGNACDVYDEGLGEGYEFEQFDDEILVSDSSISPIMMRPRVEFLFSGEEEDEQLLVVEYNGDISNSFSESTERDTNESDTDFGSGESDADLDNNDFDYEPETSETDNEREASETESEPETSESDDEPELIELDNESENSEIYAEPETSESDDEPESESEHEPETGESEDEPETGESEDEPEFSESEDEPEPSESDDESEINESDAESDYDSYSE